jgi:hypothetical protein
MAHRYVAAELWPVENLAKFLPDDLLLGSATNSQPARNGNAFT